MPVYPLRHPITTFKELNRNGERVFRQKGALPYVALGMIALANDRKTEKWFNVAGPGEPTPKFAKTFNHFGDGKVLLPAMGVMYLAGRTGERDTAKLWAASVLNATVFSQSIKMLTGKERPNQSPDAIQYHGPSTKYDSFPSGHMTAATASAVILGHQYPKAKLGFYALAACVGIARIEGANHWPSDVYWGAGAGYYGAWQVIRHKDDVLRWRF
jgi:membrane-associated phospholipid phosphatase